MISHLRTKLASFLRGLLVGACAVSLTMAICNLVAKSDRAENLANLLHLGNGIILAIILGTVAGAWLAIGGHKRIACFLGIILGILVGWLVWRAGAPHIRTIDVILISAFGEGTQQLTSFIILILLIILYFLIRWVGSICESVLLSVLSSSTPGANTQEIPSP